MLTIISGVGLLLVTLAGFSLFSMKAPKGSEAMSGMANAAIASFLIEAVHSYITGDLMNIEFFKTVGATSGSLGGVAAAITVPIAMGGNPVFAVVAGLAVGGFGILPGFLAGYVIGLISPIIEKKLPEGLNIIVGALAIAPLARIIAVLVDPAVNATLVKIGGTISAAADQSPIVMGFLLGGIMKMICTSPLSSMALTAMLGLNGSNMTAITLLLSPSFNRLKIIPFVKEPPTHAIAAIPIARPFNPSIAVSAIELSGEVQIIFIIPPSKNPITIGD